MTRSAINAKKKSLFSGSDLMKSSQWYDNTIHPTTSWNEKKHFFVERKKMWKGFRFSCYGKEKKNVFSYKNIFLFPLIVFGLSSLKCLWKKIDCGKLFFALEGFGAIFWRLGVVLHIISVNLLFIIKF